MGGNTSLIVWNLHRILKPLVKSSTLALSCWEKHIFINIFVYGYMHFSYLTFFPRKKGWLQCPYCVTSLYSKILEFSTNLLWLKCASCETSLYSKRLVPICYYSNVLHVKLSSISNYFYRFTPSPILSPTFIK